ncbi:MAG: hypothetical protein COA78_14380 [Blastopirellula sp.]|nr:MAG: hypothetical protein COA78_14380 [Blastopirellula sp.]
MLTKWNNEREKPLSTSEMKTSDLTALDWICAFLEKTKDITSHATSNFAAKHILRNYDLKLVLIPLIERSLGSLGKVFCYQGHSLAHSMQSRRSLAWT